MFFEIMVNFYKTDNILSYLNYRDDLRERLWCVEAYLFLKYISVDII